MHLQSQIVEALASGPKTLKQLRFLVEGRTDSVYRALRNLTRKGVVCQTSGEYALTKVPLVHGNEGLQARGKVSGRAPAIGSLCDMLLFANLRGVES